MGHHHVWFIVALFGATLHGDLVSFCKVRIKSWSMNGTEVFIGVLLQHQVNNFCAFSMTQKGVIRSGLKCLVQQQGT